jgi:hypothetical protein
MIDEGDEVAIYPVCAGCSARVVRLGAVPEATPDDGCFLL